MAKVYNLGVVGESKYQRQIARCHVGERMYICHEPTNPYDDKALRVDTEEGQTVGYIPKSSWLREAIHEEGRGVTAIIADITGKGREHRGVVLSVTLSDDDVPERTYGKEGASGSWFSRLFR